MPSGGSGRSGAQPSVGSVGYSYDNALVETIIGLYKTEVIPAPRPVATSGCGGIRHARMGRLVHSATAARTDWQHPAGGA